MNTFRLTARSGGRAPLAFAALQFSAFALFAAVAGTACGGDDDDDASKRFIGTNYPEPPRLGPAVPAAEPDAGTPSAASTSPSAAR
ncbi:MAG: hypothetical protein ABW133_20255 [Polyangiaceae bacterium]